MKKRGEADMAAINHTIGRVINTPSKKITTAEAQKTLRECGVLNSKNQIKRVYKGIVVPSNPRPDGKN